MENLSNIDLKDWNRWFLKYVNPLFNFGDNEEYYEKLKILQAPFYPKDWIAINFYEKIKHDARFDEELKKYFAFLYSCGFFMEFIITFEEWLQMQNWVNPSNPNIKEDTILQILSHPNGSAFLKNQLRWFPFLNRDDGH